MGAWRVCGRSASTTPPTFLETSDGPVPRVPGAPVPRKRLRGEGVVAARRPAETVEFLKYIVSADVQRQISIDQPLPPNRNASDVVTAPNQIAVFDGLSESAFLQQYLDQFCTPEVGSQVNEQTALLFGDATTPADAAAAITAPLRLTGPNSVGGCIGSPPNRSHPMTETLTPRAARASANARGRRSWCSAPGARALLVFLPLHDRAEHQVQP